MYIANEDGSITSKVLEKRLNIATDRMTNFQKNRSTETIE